MAKSRRFGTTALIITSLAVLIIAGALVIWLPTPGELAFSRLSQVHVGPIRWSNLTLQEAVADVNAQLEKKGETDLRLFVSDAFVSQPSSTFSIQLEDAPVTECARYLSDLSFASMSGSRKGITFGSLHLHAPPQPPSWRIRVRHWVNYHLWDRWKTYWEPTPGYPSFVPAPSPPTAPHSAPAPSPAPPSGGTNPFVAPTAAP